MVETLWSFFGLLADVPCYDECRKKRSLGWRNLLSPFCAMLKILCKKHSLVRFGNKELKHNYVTLKIFPYEASEHEVMDAKFYCVSILWFRIEVCSGKTLMYKIFICLFLFSAMVHIGLTIFRSIFLVMWQFLSAFCGSILQGEKAK